MKRLFFGLVFYLLCLTTAVYGQSIGPLFTEFLLFDQAISTANPFNLAARYQIVQITAGGTFNGGTFHIQISGDGTTYANADCYSTDGITGFSSNGWISAAGVWRCNVSGANFIKAVRASGTGGTTRITATASTIGNTTPSGSVGSLNPLTDPIPSVTLYDNSFTPTSNVARFVAGYQLALLTVTGTISTGTFGIQTSNDNVNFGATDCYALTGGTAQTTSNWLNATGVYRCNISGASWLRATLASGTPGTLKISGQLSLIGFAKPPGTGLGAAINFTDLTGTASDAQIPNLNTLSTGLTATRCVHTDGSGLLTSTASDCGTATVDQTGNYTWTGIQSWKDANFSILDDADATKIVKFELSGQTTGTTRTYSLPNASTNLLGGSDLGVTVQAFGADITAIEALAGTGFPTRTAANTWAQRQFTGQTGNIVITNPLGIAGDVLIDLGTTAVQTDQSNTWTTGDQNFANAASVTIPSATGAAPTLEGRIATNTTTHRAVFGNGTTTKTFAFTDEVQFLNANLTALAGLSGASGAIPYFSGVGAMATASTLLCTDTAGQHLNITSLSPLTFACGTSSTGGISGGTINKLPKYLSATNIGPGIITDDGANATVAGGLIVGSTPWLILDTSAIAASDKTWTVQNIGGTILPSAAAGTYTNGHVITANVAAGIVTLQDGGAAGAGTWTDASANTGTNKTLVAVGAGGTNTITLPVVASFDGGSITASGGCQDPVKVQINSGPQEYAILCATPASAQWGVKVPMLKSAVGTFIVRMEVNDSVSSSHVYAGTVKAQCRASGAAPSSTWGSTQTISATMVTASNTYQAASAAVTANGTCSADSDLYVQFDASGSMTDTGTARLIGVRIYQST